MTTKNEPLTGIQARIEELHNTIAEKEEQIKSRTKKLKDDIKEEVSPEKMIRKYPFEAAGASFLAGLILARTLRGCKKSAGKVEQVTLAPQQHFSTQPKTALSAIGFEVMRSVKDIGFSYLQRYLEKKIK